VLPVEKSVFGAVFACPSQTIAKPEAHTILDILLPP
jgi:hypothetical protein